MPKQELVGDYMNQIYVMKGNPKTEKLEVPHLILAVSYDCNLNCKHCYNSDSKYTALSLNDWKSIISQWRRYFQGNHTSIVHFKGGEPFLYPGLDELLKFSAGKRLRIMITTNGTILDEKIFRNLEKINKTTGGNLKLIVSLNGSNPETDSLLRGKGAFEKTLKFIKKLSELEIAFDINYVIHSGNEHDLEQNIQLAKRLGAVQFNILPLILKGKAREKGIEKADYGKLLKTLKRIYESGNKKIQEMLSGSIIDIINRVASGQFRCLECVAGYRGLLYILPDGNTYSCPNTVLPDFCAGNIREIGIKGAIESTVLKNLRQVDRPVQETNDLALCINRNF